MYRPTLVLFSLVALTAAHAPISFAHDGHDHEDAPASAAAAVPPSGLTGAGDYKFRLNAELSALPEEVAAGIVRAHGGIAKAPSGELYFGLEGTGVVRVSADLRTKTLLSPNEATTGGGLHNTTYVDREGGCLVVPDNVRGRVLVLTLDGEVVASLDRPGEEIDPHYKDPNNVYAPTDTEFAPDGILYICDGYGPGKRMLTADLEKSVYTPRVFGGPVTGEGRTEGKFSTNHGVTYDPGDKTLAIADRERHWFQKLTLAGEFVRGIDLDGASPCDVDFVEWQGAPLTVVGCLRGKEGATGVVQLLRDDQIVATLRPKADLGIEAFEHLHNAVGVVVGGKLYVLCYGWNPGCYAVLEHVAE